MGNLNLGVLDGARRIASRVRDVVIEGGLPGAALGYRLRGATLAGAPATGTWRAGDLVPDRNGVLWTCTVAGTPGTWVPAGPASATFSFGASGAAPSSGTYTTGQVLVDQNGVVRVCTAGGSPGTWTRAGQKPWEFYVDDYGALGNGKVISDATVAGGALSTLTSAAQAAFTSGDTGKHIVANGAGPAINGSSGGGPLSTTITFVSATSVTLASAATNAITNAFAVYGTDDTAAINNAITAASAYATANHYFAEVIFSAKIYVISGALIQGGATKGNMQIPLPVVPLTGNPTMILKLTGVRCSAGPVMFQASSDTPAPATEGTVLMSTLMGQAYSGTFGQPAVIGGPTSEQGYTGGFTNLWNDLMPVIDGITVMAPAAPTVTGIDLTSCNRAEVLWARALAFLPQNQMASFNPWWVGGPFPKGLVMPQNGNNAHCVIGYFAAEGFRLGMLAYEHTTFQEFVAIFCGAGLSLLGQNAAGGATAGHGVTGLRYCAEDNGDHIQVTPTSMGLNIVSMQCEACNQFGGSGIAGVYVNDASNRAYGRIGMQTAQGVSSVTVSGAANLEIVLDMPQTRGFQTPPAVPATTVALTNPFVKHMNVLITSGGAAVTAIAINGTATGLTLGATGTVYVRVPSFATITLTYASTAPTWQWYTD